MKYLYKGILLISAIALLVSCSNSDNSVSVKKDDSEISSKNDNPSKNNTKDNNSNNIDVATMLDYPIIYTTTWPNETNTGLIGVGISIDELTYSRSLHLHKDGKIISNGVTLDPQSEVAQKIDIDLERSTIIIDGLHVYDGIYIYEDCNIKNVIIRKCYITEGAYGISMKSLTTHTIVEDCTIDGKGSQRKGILARNTIIRRCNISQYQDGIYMSTKVVVDGNYVHNLHTFTGAHADATQCSGPGTILMVNNNFDAIGHNACLMSSDQESDLTYIQMENNYLAGGNYTIYIVKKTGGTNVLKNHLIKNNIFEADSYGYGYITYEPHCNIVVTGNKDQQGKLLSINNQ